MNNENYIPDPTVTEEHTHDFICPKCDQPAFDSEKGSDGLCVNCTKDDLCPNCGHNQDSELPTHCEDCAWPLMPKTHPCPMCGQQTKGSRGRVTGMLFPCCPDCMKKEEQGVDAAIQAVCFLVKAVNKQPDSFSAWLASNNDALPEPQSFTEFLDQTGDSIETNPKHKHIHHN